MTGVQTCALPICAAFTDIALKASKNINITDHFSLPLFVQAIVSPSFDKTYLIAGLSIGF